MEPDWNTSQAVPQRSLTKLCLDFINPKVKDAESMVGEASK
jgi:hypothetical protein